MLKGLGRAVLFDMDGLMFDTERLSARAFIECGKAFGLNVTSELTDRTIGRDLENARRLFKKYFGDKLDFYAYKRAVDAYMKQTVENDGVPLKAGLMELLKYLQDSGYTMALATGSSSQIVELYFAHSDVKRYFSAVVCGDMISCGKPDPEIFLRAAELIGAEPKLCTVLEDSPAGILAAHNAGMRSIMVPDLIPPSREDWARAGAVLGSLCDVPAYLDAQVE